MEILSWTLVLGISTVLSTFFGSIAFFLVDSTIEYYRDACYRRELRTLRYQHKKSELQASLKDKE